MSQNFSKNPSEPMEKKFSTYDKSSRNNYHSSRRLKGASRHKFSLLNEMHRLGYTIGKRIGEGSYSKVYWAEHHTNNNDQKSKAFSNKPIACKMVDQRYTSMEYNLKFLPRELRIVQHLVHPNIIQTHAIIECGPFVCFFMDFCPHGDLLDYIQNTGQLSDNLARLYFKQICLAIKYLHGNGICHRDIKCENVLIQNENLVKLSDFGFSKKFRRQHGQDVMSTTFCGSASYASPQVLKGIPYDPKAYDIWSLGCLLFIMATGDMPYDDKNIASTIQKQQKKIVNYPPQIIICEQLDNLIKKLLEPVEKLRLTIDKVLNHPWLLQ